MTPKCVSDPKLQQKPIFKNTALEKGHKFKNIFRKQLNVGTTRIFFQGIRGKKQQIRRNRYHKLRNRIEHSST